MATRRLLALLACTLAVAPAALGKTTDNERKIGKEGDDEVAKQYRVITSPAYVERVQRIGAEVAKAAASQEPDLTLKFTVLDIPDVNAFSLPNGSIYVNKGLIDIVQSDDELAGVLAHEAAHAVRHHLLQLIKKQQRFDISTIAAVLVGAAAGVNVGEVAQVGSLVSTGRANAFNQTLETEADHYAVDFLQKTHFNPVGMLTFMERLARQDTMSSQGLTDYGIFRTHPLSVQRKLALTTLLNQRGITINRRQVMKSLQAQAVETTVKGKLAAQVMLGPNVLLTVADDGDAKAMTRANNIADRLNKVLGPGSNWNSPSVGGPGSTVLLFSGTPVYEVSDADVALLGSPAKDLAEQARKHLYDRLRAEWVDTLRDKMPTQASR
ncbi:MAG TPA: M48 family metalloprotease [Armatimonadota bacterium]|jgi:predicted Zn-dependent protease